MNDLDTRLKVV